VTSDDITTEQAQRVGAVVGRQLRYLGRLRERLNVMGFPPTDPLFLSVTKAYHAVHDLSVRMHYLSVASGVGRPERPESASG
jgi:hypothetical protein